MKKMVNLIAILGVLGVFFVSFRIGGMILNKHRAKISMIHMRRIESLLLLDRPRLVDEDYVRRLLAERGQAQYLLDGWGNPIQVELEIDDKDHPRYKLISLGRDGKRGSCCSRFVEDWDEDAILMSQDWLQVWG